MRSESYFLPQLDLKDDELAAWSIADGRIESLELEETP